VPGEDPLHISQYARALIPSIQGTDPLHLNIVATCKHYLGYDMEDWGGHERYGYDAKITTQDLVEYYLPTFKACVRDAKGASLMVSGLFPPHESRWTESYRRPRTTLSMASRCQPVVTSLAKSLAAAGALTSSTTMSPLTVTR
jgi:hypothetical protein